MKVISNSFISLVPEVWRKVSISQDLRV